MAGRDSARSGRPDLRHLPQAHSTDDPRRAPFVVVMGSVLVGVVVVDAVLPDHGWWDHLAFAALFLGGLVLQRLLRGATRVDAVGIDVRAPSGRRTHVDWGEVLDVQVGTGPFSRSRVMTPRGAVPLHGMPRRAVRQLREQTSR
ncbi:MAG: hypothetical protein PGN11_14490 [Quadrisphaera sp.]